MGLALLAVAYATSKLSGAYIIAEFPDRPMPRDALFELLPYVSSARYLTAVALFGAFAILAAYVIKVEPHRLPEVLAAFAVMYLLRAFVMAMTPLASSYGDGAFVFPIVQPGMFPSGHSGAATLATMLVDRRKAPRVWMLQAALMWVVWMALIVAHGHYSIDVVGGALLSYFVVSEWRHGRLMDPVKRLLGVR